MLWSKVKEWIWQYKFTFTCRLLSLSLSSGISNLHKCLLLRSYCVCLSVQLLSSYTLCAWLANRLFTVYFMHNNNKKNNNNIPKCVRASIESSRKHFCRHHFHFKWLSFYTQWYRASPLFVWESSLWLAIVDNGKSAFKVIIC